MATLKEAAKGFVPKQTKNIADLNQVPVDVELRDGEGIDNDGKPFQYKYLELNGEHYRVPGSVIGQIKDLLEAKPTLQFVRVKKTGAGINTRYTVIPL